MFSFSATVSGGVITNSLLAELCPDTSARPVAVSIGPVDVAVGFLAALSAAAATEAPAAAADVDAPAELPTRCFKARL